MLADIPGTRAEAIFEVVRELLEMKVPEALMRTLCSAIEKLTDDAYAEGREDGLFDS